MILPDPHDPLLLLLAGLVIDAAFGDMPAVFAHLPHPAALAGRAVEFFDRKLNRRNRSARSRRERGTIVLLVLVGGAAGIGWLVQLAGQATPAGAGLEALAIGLLVRHRGVQDQVAAVAAALDWGGLPAGRDAIRPLVGDAAGALDEHGVSRAAIECLAENLGDGLVAPVFWYLLLGLPGLFACRMTEIIDGMIGRRSGPEGARGFGWAAARLDHLLGVIPSRLSACLLIVAAVFAGRAMPARGLATMLREGWRHPWPNIGWPIAAMAGALDLTLAGPRPQGGLVINEPWLGDGSPRAAPRDIARALRLSSLAGRLLAGMVFGVWLAMRAG